MNVMEISFRSRENLGRWFGYLVLAVFAAISASSFLPQDPTLFNLQRVLGLVNPSDPRLALLSYGKIDFFRALTNSVIFTILAVAPQIAFSALAAYAFARLRFAGSQLIFSLFLCATMIPAVVLFIPNFILIKDLGWLNTFQGMAAPYALMTPFAVFFLRQMFLSTPRELEECALVDGASYPTIFFRIVLPLHRPALATLTIITALSAWNEFGRSLRIGAGNVRCHHRLSTATSGWHTGLERADGLHRAGDRSNSHSPGAVRTQGRRVVSIQRSK
jgi:ABC-type glycerol-3-phosphate transport system permease component